jgi:EpsI family protein
MKFSREFCISFVVLTVAGLLLGFISHGEETPLRRSFVDFPLHVDRWTGKELGLEVEVLQALKVDDYMMRRYQGDQENPIGFYVGYYKSMRQGAAYHSPKNCLPGSGWYFIKTGKVTLDVLDSQGKHVEINKFIIQKGLDKQLVLYWYQDRGRIITSEYWAKIYMVVDAILKNRTDGAFVRITVPFTGDNEEMALRRGQAFVEKVFPLLQAYLPS